MVSVRMGVTCLKHDFWNVAERAFNFHEFEATPSGWPYGDVHHREAEQTMVLTYEDGETDTDDDDVRRVRDDTLAMFRRLATAVVQRVDPAAAEEAMQSAHWPILQTRHVPFYGTCWIEGDDETRVVHMVGWDGTFGWVEGEEPEAVPERLPSGRGQDFARLKRAVVERFAAWNADAGMATVALLPGPSRDEAEEALVQQWDEPPGIPVESHPLALGAMPAAKLAQLDTPDLEGEPSGYVPTRQPAHAMFDESYFGWRRQRMGRPS